MTYFQEVGEMFLEKIVNFPRDLAIGAVCGASFVFLSIYTGLSIGMPLLPYSTALGYKIILSGIAAPLFEEIMFRGFLPIFFITIFYVLGLDDILAIIAGSSVSIALFSAFHWFVYGASLAAMNASFLGALVFGIFTMILTLILKSPVAAISLHAIFNIYLISKLYFALTIGVM